MCRKCLSSSIACLLVGVAASTAAAQCVVPDNGSGTATLPPLGCDYNGDPIVITSGLPAGTTIQIVPKMTNFICGSSFCSLGLPPTACEGPGGSLGGHGQCFQTVLEMQMTGTGALAGFNRFIPMSSEGESHSAPRAPGDPVQMFPHDMMQLQGQLFGDPDFDFLAITAGGALGLPSPGQTTLTRLGPPGSDFQVDSFFDIEYRIEFQGAPGSVLEGFGGAQNGQSRFSTGGGSVTEDCCVPNGSCGAVAVGTCVPNGGFIPPAGCLGDGNGNGVDDGCEQLQDEACCLSDGSCIIVPAGSCAAMGGFNPPGGACLGDGNGNGVDDGCEQIDHEDCCLPDGTCAPVAAGTCTAIGGTIPSGGFCIGDGNGNGRDDACEQIDLEDCCLPDGTCAPVIAGTCTAIGGMIPAGGFCVGDGNGNGIDDACEQIDLEDCCLPDGTCAAVAAGTCTAIGGMIPAGGFCVGDGNGNGVDDACENQPMEDCCRPDGSCVTLPVGTCAAIGGTIPAGGFCLGDGNGNGKDDACEDPILEDCCLPDGTCAALPVGDCAAMGGFLPPGGFCLGDGDGNGIDDACEQVEYEDCCFPDGSCGPIAIGGCAAAGGFIPPGGFCLGDGDGNGVDDACEEPNEDPFQIEFSLDIGSDKELSDPFADGDEGFDPGDVYLWHSAPVTPPLVPGGRDGFKDDMFLFGLDPLPSTPDFAIPPATRVPVGSGNVALYNDYFDLDGHDQTDFPIEQYVDPASPLESPIFITQVGLTECVYRPDHVLLSYDDDKAPGWPVSDVPVTAGSPAGVSSYGATASRDEVIYLGLTPGALPPLTKVAGYPVASEEDVHADLAPNPDGVEEEDDDVDSLDAVIHPDVCPLWYFTADHEARLLTLDPGSIYTFGPTLVIDQGIHLGLLDDPATPDLIEDADIDAFEFTWLQVPGATLGLAVVFSVDEDDPLTAARDESGGLDPNMLYASFMTGGNFPLLPAADRLDDDVDALTIWRAEPVELLPDCKPSDVNCDGNTDILDLGIVRQGPNWNQSPPAVPRADVNGDGTADILDLGVIRQGANWNVSTGPCNCP